MFVRECLILGNGLKYNVTKSLKSMPYLVLASFSIQQGNFGIIPLFGRQWRKPESDGLKSKCNLHGDRLTECESFRTGGTERGKALLLAPLLCFGQGISQPR